jgi:organic radical activating enzyme
VEDGPGSGNFRSIPNPVALDTMVGTLHRWCTELPGVHHSFSLTGGEPLAQYRVLGEWLPALRAILPVSLETNGTLPDALAHLLEQLDWIAMDIKLASLTGTPTPWDNHRDFLHLARRRSCFVKVVVGEETPPEEVMEAACLVAAAGSDIPLFLQPVTRNGRVTMNSRQLLDLQTCAARIHAAVRVVPQTHRFIGLL